MSGASGPDRLGGDRHVSAQPDLDYPYWVEDGAFDLEFHVRYMALPAPGHLAELWKQASRLHCIPLDLDRPPWELYIIEGLRAPDFPADSFAL
jgi:hypothetical protein